MSEIVGVQPMSERHYATISKAVLSIVAATEIHAKMKGAQYSGCSLPFITTAVNDVKNTDYLPSDLAPVIARLRKEKKLFFTMGSDHMGIGLSSTQTALSVKNNFKQNPIFGL